MTVFWLALALLALCLLVWRFFWNTAAKSRISSQRLGTQVLNASFKVAPFGLGVFVWTETLTGSQLLRLSTWESIPKFLRWFMATPTSAADGMSKKYFTILTPVKLNKDKPGSISTKWEFIVSKDFCPRWTITHNPCSLTVECSSLGDSVPHGKTHLQLQTTQVLGLTWLHPHSEDADGSCYSAVLVVTVRTRQLSRRQTSFGVLIWNLERKDVSFVGCASVRTAATSTLLIDKNRILILCQDVDDSLVCSLEHSPSPDDCKEGTQASADELETSIVQPWHQLSTQPVAQFCFGRNEVLPIICEIAGDGNQVCVMASRGSDWYIANKSTPGPVKRAFDPLPDSVWCGAQR
jgi:hypothetical protein